MTQRYKITVEYDGTDLLGWQKQLDGPSAQEFLERRFEAFCQEKTEVYGAGRTDAGVHALAQIAHFDLNREVDPFRLREAVNAHLRSMEAPVSVLAAEKNGTGLSRPLFGRRTRLYLPHHQPPGAACH